MVSCRRRHGQQIGVERVSTDVALELQFQLGGQPRHKLDGFRKIIRGGARIVCA